MAPPADRISRPTPAQLALLAPFERGAFALSDFINSQGAAKALSHAFLRTVGTTWVYYCSRNLTHLLGLRALRELRVPRGLLLASNHRSFFDQYVVACWLFRATDLLRRVYFPVRSEFFYERPLGIFVSLVMSGLSMYPPVFRDPAKRDFNLFGTRRLVEILEHPGSVVGVHPEGRRNKGDDPYTLLKAQPGVGKLILEARPTVLPVFINGLGNDFMAQVRGNFDGTGTPIIIVFGEPLELERYYPQAHKLRAQKEVADLVVEAIAGLGQREREYRAQIARHPVRGPVFL